MYLSHLLVNVGADPDRERPGRLWLRNTYRIHQRLCMAFPSKQRKDSDSAFLQPYCPDDFNGAHVHTRRSANGGFLFRVDPIMGGNPVILVQSASQPDWDYAFHNARYLLAAPPTVRAFAPDVSPGQCFRFRLQANPTKRLHKRSTHASGKPLQAKWVKKRVPVPPDAWLDWLLQRAERCGFIVEGHVRTEPGYVYFHKKDKPQAARLRSVLFEGRLAVKDEEAFLEALCSGIGPAKAYGFGLLSLARA